MTVSLPKQENRPQMHTRRGRAVLGEEGRDGGDTSISRGTRVPATIGAGRGLEQILPHGLGRVRPGQHLHLALPASRRENKVVSNHRVSGTVAVPLANCRALGVSVKQSRALGPACWKGAVQGNGLPCVPRLGGQIGDSAQGRALALHPRRPLLPATVVAPLQRCDI